MDWRDAAACLNEDPDLFFPTGATGPIGREIEQAKTVCRGCGVRNACLHWALAERQLAGIWGGLTEEERRSWARRRDDSVIARARRSA